MITMVISIVDLSDVEKVTMVIYCKWQFNM